MQLGGGGGNVDSSKIIDDSIVNADVNSAAAIDASKIAGDVETTGAQNVGGVKTFTDDPIIPDEVYGVGWNGVLEPPTKNAVYDELQKIKIPACGVTTKNTADASTTQNIAHGLGRAPTYVKLLGILPATSQFCFAQAIFNGAQSAIYGYADTGSGTIESAGSGFNLGPVAAGDYAAGTITVDGTNIMIAWTKIGSAAGTAQLLWEAI